MVGEMLPSSSRIGRSQTRSRSQPPTAVLPVKV